MNFKIDNTHLRYKKDWTPDFPYCTRCGTITAAIKGICCGCLTGVPWDIDRTSVITDKILEDESIFKG